jgi:predicted transcriptional regulator
MVRKLSDAEYRFMEEIWLLEPVKSSVLVNLCQEKFGWKKSTTYTVIKNLINKEVLVNENTFVRTLVTKDHIAKAVGDELVDKAFNGNVVDMFAAFLQDRKLTKEEYLKLEKMINDAYKDK